MPKNSKPVDSRKSFEKALERGLEERYVFRLYIAGSTPRSLQAISNLRAICEESLKNRYELEVIDIFQQPHRAQPEQIVVAPTLIKARPLPERRLIGDLSNRDRVLMSLDITRKP